MKTIKENTENTIIVNKSKFITTLFKITNENEVKIYLKDIKDKYNDANHHCFAYIINNIKRFNDDNEPNGAAGLPILNILENNNIDNVLCVVTRYFGGIKLGAGGLIRAYSKSAKEALKNSTIINLIPGYLIEIVFNYEDTKKIDNILKKYQIVNKQFNELITYQFIIPSIEYDDIKNELNNYIIKITEKESLLIE